MLENKLVEHCSPTLAGLKTANMFNYRFSSIGMLSRELEDANEKLNGKCVYVDILWFNGHRVLLYVYRKKTSGTGFFKTGSDEISPKIWI